MENLVRLHEVIRVSGEEEFFANEGYVARILPNDILWYGRSIAVFQNALLENEDIP